MVDKLAERRPRGRPREFDPDTALDRAVAVFWRLGYAGADTETLAKAMGVTKPSIYGTFGTKEQLFLRALERYGATIGAEPLSALRGAATVRRGVAAFFATVAQNVSGARGASGCLHACVAAQCTEAMAPVREFLAAGIAATDRAIAARFREAVGDGELPSRFQADDRARLMTDLMQALALRARAGTPLARLQTIASDNTEAILSGAP